jgi:hypothetical protein
MLGPAVSTELRPAAFVARHQRVAEGRNIAAVAGVDEIRTDAPRCAENVLHDVPVGIVLGKTAPIRFVGRFPVVRAGASMCLDFFGRTRFRIGNEVVWITHARKSVGWSLAHTTLSKRTGARESIRCWPSISMNCVPTTIMTHSNAAAGQRYEREHTACTRFGGHMRYRSCLEKTRRRLSVIDSRRKIAAYSGRRRWRQFVRERAVGGDICDPDK